jgi:hypothetical protein
MSNIEIGEHLHISVAATRTLIGRLPAKPHTRDRLVVTAHEISDNTHSRQMFVLHRQRGGCGAAERKRQC